MKTIIFSVLFLNAAMLFAQGNLQFNQIVIVSDQVQTVPTGKVWKVESYQQQQVGVNFSGPTTACTDLNRPRPYHIDGITYNDLKGTGYGSGSMPYMAQNSFPIWLKAGQTLKTSCPGDFLSVIEFNIVP